MTAINDIVNKSSMIENIDTKFQTICYLTNRLLSLSGGSGKGFGVLGGVVGLSILILYKVAQCDCDVGTILCNNLPSCWHLD